MARKKKRCLISSKKGIITDMIVFITALVVISMIFLFAFKVFSDVKPDIYDSINSTEGKAMLDDVEAKYPSVFDGLILVIMVGLWVAAIVSSLFSEQHPIIFGFMMLIMIFLFIAAGILANFFEETFQDADLSSLMVDFPKINFIVNHLMELSIGVAATILLALLGKKRFVG